MKRLCAYIVLSAILIGTVAEACMLAPPQAVNSFANLVDRTDKILYAEITDIHVEANKVSYTFDVIEVIKGEAIPTGTFQLPLVYDGFPNDWDSESDDFLKHQMPAFWDGRIARNQILPNCQVIPTFGMGRKYLLFLAPPYHVAGFEEISSPDDMWLDWVKRSVKNDFEASNDEIISYINRHRAVYIGRCGSDNEGVRVTLQTRIAGDTLSGAIRDLDFGRSDAQEAGCFGSGGEVMLLFYGNEDMPTKVVPVVSGQVQIGKIVTNLLSNKDRELPIEDIIRHIVDK